MLLAYIDTVDRRHVAGWVHDPADPDGPVSLLVTVDGVLVERVVANAFRPDVAQAGVGDGRYGFHVRFDPPLLSTRPWLLGVQMEATGQHLPGSPVRLPATDEFSEDAAAAFAGVLGAAATEAEFDRRIAFLTQQHRRLVGLRAAMPAPRAGDGPFALVIDERMPAPDVDAGSCAILSHMRSLRRLGYRVSFACTGMGAESAVLEDAGIEVCGAPAYGSVEDVLLRQAGRFELVYLHRVGVALSYGALARRHQKRARIVYSVADLHHLRVARQGRYEERAELLRTAEVLQRQEFWAAQNADAVITHSAFEAGLLRQAVAAERVHVVAWSAVPRRRPPGFARREGMAFMGDFSHAPNAAAVVVLRDDWLPAVRAHDPAATCRVVGRGLSPHLHGPGIEPVGWVEALDSVLHRVRLTVAPLPFGAGLKGKVMESLAAGIPCVCSPVAAEGFAFEGELRDLVATDSAMAAGTILRLLRDPGYNRRLGEMGVALAERDFSDAAVDRAMARAIGVPQPAAAG